MNIQKNETPEEEKNLIHSWTAKGRRDPHMTETQRRSDPLPHNIDIFEEPYSFRMYDQNEGKEAYGVPVSKEVGVQLMTDLLLRLCEAEVPLKELPKLTRENNDQDEKCEKMLHLLKALVRSFGISFDRSILLKILSQPSCEGLRFYPCIKREDGTSASTFDANKKDFLSLVVVGIDRKGEDLHFNPSLVNTTQVDDANSSMTSAPNRDSLLSEYGHPPTRDKFIDTKQYWLLDSAKNKLISDNQECKQLL